MQTYCKQSISSINYTNSTNNKDDMKIGRQDIVKTSATRSISSHVCSTSNCLVALSLKNPKAILSNVLVHNSGIYDGLSSCAIA